MKDFNRRKFFVVFPAILLNGLPKSQTEAPMLNPNFLKEVFAWSAVFIGILGILMLVAALFFYLIAAGEEPKMKKGNNILWGGIVCVVGAVALFFVGKLL